MDNNGIKIKINNKELLIQGTKEDLIDLADYINRIANSKEEIDHIHLDELTLLSNDSEIKELIIEKD